jgi:predicted alpha/beta hydrolase family esterase
MLKTTDKVSLRKKLYHFSIASLYNFFMQRNIFIFHGTAGNPQENWFSWLKKELEKNGHRVFVPQFPTPIGESLESWLGVLDRYKQQINKNTILIGHSKGGLFLLRLLEKLKQPVYASFLVSTAIGIKPYVFYDLNHKFAHGYKFDWIKIRSNSKHFIVYHSDNDPYTCLANGEQISKKLNINLTFIPNSGHFNTKSGYTKFDKLYEDIYSLLINNS